MSSTAWTLDMGIKLGSGRKLDEPILPVWTVVNVDADAGSVSAISADAGGVTVMEIDAGSVVSEVT